MVLSLDWLSNSESDDAFVEELSYGRWRCLKWVSKSTKSCKNWSLINPPFNESCLLILQHVVKMPKMKVNLQEWAGKCLPHNETSKASLSRGHMDHICTEFRNALKCYLVAVGGGRVWKEEPQSLFCVDIDLWGEFAVCNCHHL